MKKLCFAGIAVFLFFQLYAQADITRLKDKTSLDAAKIESKAIEWRRNLHEHPELGNRERRRC